MLSSRLILSGRQSEREKEAQKLIFEYFGINHFNHPDLVVLESETSLGINDIRRLQKKLFLKPFSAPIKIALIKQAENLTLPAQNALLKTLEEPPAQTLIILLASGPKSLLPTITSRCLVTQLAQKPQIESKSTTHALDSLTEILNSKIGERINQAQKYSQRPLATNFVEELIILWRELILIKAGLAENNQVNQLTNLPYNQLTRAANNSVSCREKLRANTNPRLTIEDLLISYPSLN
ncbi:hypothetical protein ACFL0Y_01820 [Patescibacteria group bacterium]